MRDRVRMKSTGNSSAKFGACEVCLAQISEVYSGTPDNGVSYVFGHRGCVEHALKDPKVLAQAQANYDAMHAAVSK